METSSNRETKKTNKKKTIETIAVIFDRMTLQHPVKAGTSQGKPGKN